MDNDTTHPAKPQHNHRKKHLVLAIAALLLVIALGIATAMFLKQNLVKNSGQTAAADKSASDVYKAFTAKGAVSALSVPAYALLESNASNVYYKDSSKPYSIMAIAPLTATYTASVAGTSDRTAVFDQARTLMGNQTMAPATSPVADTETNHYLVFQNSVAYCQLNAYATTTDKGSFATYQLSCTDKKALATTYQTVDDLLATYVKSGQAMPNVTSAWVSTESKDKVSYSIVYATIDNVSHALLFGKLDNNTEYIGDIGQGDKQYFDGRYYITPDVKAKMADAKYSGFLTQAIIGIKK